MALRALDNTLPTAALADRPKKASKLPSAVPLPVASPGSGRNGNDENSPPASGVKRNGEKPPAPGSGRKGNDENSPPASGGKRNGEKPPAPGSGRKGNDENSPPASGGKRNGQKPPAPGSGRKRNDENSAPRATAAAEQAVEYVRSEDLRPVPSPKAKASGLLVELDSKDWVKVCEALNDARRLAIHHPVLLDPILEKVILAIVKTMKNPRSAVLKTSVMACTDIFTSFGNLISSSSDGTFDKLMLQLLLKASQDKRFVCEEAEKAMRAMATSTPPLPLLKKLKTYVHHSNLRVRAKAAVAMAHCTSRMDMDTMNEFGMPALLQVAAELLNDRLPEAREAARSIVSSVHAAFSKDAAGKKEKEQEKEDGPDVAAAWETLCALSLPPISAQAVTKIVSQPQ